MLYEDNHIIAVNKRVGEIVQGDKTGDVPLSEIVAAFIAARDNKPGAAFIGVIHRLDRPVSGIVLFAKTSKALARMNELFRSGEMEKIYWAIVANMPEQTEATVTHYLTRNEKLNRSYASDKPIEGSKEASLIYKHIASSDRYHLLEVKLLTGRHHQIRCQLSKLGMPVRGDLKYGSPRSNRDGGISLHARSIRFVHPVSKKDIFIEAPVPEERLWQEIIP
ncbi:MAG: RluA family pseudouridine synthase [Bacteroidales bacterium]|nr:RluA family pseudouridine synthase [Bacteroidales bacterium]